MSAPAAERSVAFLIRAALGAGLAAAAATCSLASLDGYASGGAGGTGGAVADGGPGGGGTGAAPPDAGCAAAEGACVEAAPPGWTGPFALYEGSPAAAPACPARFPMKALDAHLGLEPVDPTSCAACDCTAPAGVTCPATATMYLYTDLGCNQPCGSISIAPAGCGPTVDGMCPGAVAFTMTSSNGSGSCAPTGGGATLPPVSWQAALRGCAPPLTPRDCPSGKTCAPLPAAPFEGHLCVAQAGDVACPGAPYAVKRSAFTGTDDTRGCTPCACAPPVVTCGAFALNPGNDCFGPFFMSTTSLPIACHAAPSGGTYSFDYTAEPHTAPCVKSGGQPIGDVAPEQPITVCCAG